jgi:hypothetical protein
MKKIVSIITVVAIPFFAAANNGSDFDRATFNVCSVIFLIGMFMLFILTILKRIMDHRLKNKIIDKGIPENLVASVLQPGTEKDRDINIKWCAILTGLGLGLTIVYNQQPLGIHSLAIMSFCVAASFLGYFLFLKFSQK